MIYFTISTTTRYYVTTLLPLQVVLFIYIQLLHTPHPIYLFLYLWYS